MALPHKTIDISSEKVYNFNKDNRRTEHFD